MLRKIIESSNESFDPIKGTRYNPPTKGYSSQQGAVKNILKKSVDMSHFVPATEKSSARTESKTIPAGTEVYAKEVRDPADGSKQLLLSVDGFQISVPYEEKDAYVQAGQS